MAFLNNIMIMIMVKVKEFIRIYYVRDVNLMIKRKLCCSPLRILIELGYFQNKLSYSCRKMIVDK